MLPIETTQTRVITQFKRVIAADQLSQSYIFAGPAGVGKMQVAQWLAMRLFCLNVQDGSPCGECAECQRILSHNHPDVVTISTEDKTIKVDAIRELKQEMSKSGMEGNQRVFIINDADKMTTGASNSLLKFYEEPVANTLVILLTSAKNRLLPTILSRAQMITFLPADAIRIEASLVDEGIARNVARFASRMANEPAQALALAQDEAFNAQLTAVDQLLNKVAKRDLEAFVQVQSQLLPIAKNTTDQAQLLTLIALTYQLAMRHHYQLNEIESGAVNALSQQSGAQLADQTAAVLVAQQQLDQNVSFQSDLEQLILKLIG